MNCDRARELFSPFLDGELTGEDRRWLEAHLEECAGCREALEELQRAVGLVRDLPKLEPPAGLADRIVAAGVDASGGVSGDATENIPAALVTLPFGIRASRRVVSAVSGLAAVMVVGVLGVYWYQEGAGSRPMGEIRTIASAVSSEAAPRQQELSAERSDSLALADGEGEESARSKRGAGRYAM